MKEPGIGFLFFLNVFGPGSVPTFAG